MVQNVAEPFVTEPAAVRETAGNRRRRIVVDKPLQVRIVLATTAVPTAFLLATCVLFGYFCKRLSDEALVAGVELTNVVPLLCTALCFLLAALGFLAWSALRFSSRIAGPMYRIRSVLESVRDGQLGARVRLRRHDVLASLARDVNDCLAALERRIDGASGPDAPAVHSEPEAVGSAAAKR